MTLLSRFFYRRPPDGLLELSERVYVFDSCFSTEVLPEGMYQIYLREVVMDLYEQFPSSSFLAFNFREGEKQSKFARLLNEYDVTVIDYPRHYENCPILPLSLIQHFLRVSDSWLADQNHHNVVLLHCERGGWPLLAFIISSFLVYRKLHSVEGRTLDAVHREAPKGLLQLLSPLNPYASQLRYLQYVAKRNITPEWPPPERALSLDCVIIRAIPSFDSENGCRPIFRIYGRNLNAKAGLTTHMLYSTYRKKKALLKHYRQADCDVIKIDIQCLVQGDVVLECLHLETDSEREVLMFRVLFNTAFIRSNILMLNAEDLDILWEAKDRYPRGFRAEVLFGESENMSPSKSSTAILNGDDKGGLPIEAFSRVQELFSGIDWSDSNGDASWVLKQLAAINDARDMSRFHGRGSSFVSPIDSEDESKASSAADSSDDAFENNSKSCANSKSRVDDSLEDEHTPASTKSGNGIIFDCDVTPLPTRAPSTPSVLPSSPPPPLNTIDEHSPTLSLSNSLPASPPSPAPKAPPPQGVSPIDVSSPNPPPPPSLPIEMISGPQAASVPTPPPLPPPSSGVYVPKAPPHPFKHIGNSALKAPPSSVLVDVSLPKTPPPPLPGVSVSKGPPPPPPPPPFPVSKSPPPPPPPPALPLSKAPPPPPPPPPPALPVSKAPPPPPVLHISKMPPPPPLPPVSKAPSPPQQPVAPVPKAPPPPPPAPGVSFAKAPTPPPPPPSVSAGKAPPPPPPLPGVSSKVPPPPPPPGFSATKAPPTPSPPVFSTPKAPPPPPSIGRSAPKAPPPPIGRSAPKAPSPPIVQSTSTAPKPPAAPPLPQGAPPPPPLSKGSNVPPPLLTSAGKGKYFSGPAGISKSRNASGANNSPKKATLKPLHWVKVTRAAQGSLWADSQKLDNQSRAPEIDITELESLFAAVSVSDANDANKSSGKRGSKINKPEKIQLIDLRRAYNCEIMLSKVKIPLSEMISAVLALDSSALDIDQVENLIKFCPTKEEMETLKNYTGEKEMLGRCEQFFLELMKVPRVESKLRVFAFRITFYSQVDDLRRDLGIINDATKEVKESLKLRQIMQTILTLGNALNQGTARGSAVGFKLDSLLKLSDTRARNNKMTLMHYLCKLLSEKLPELLDFYKDLVHLEAASKIQLKTLAEEMQAVSKGLEKVEQELIGSEADGIVSVGFRKVLRTFLHSAEADVRTLTSLYSEVGRNADSLSQYFGEDPARCPFEQVTQILSLFVKMFKKSKDENEKQAEAEKKRIEKEERTPPPLVPNSRKDGHFLEEWNNS